jgi:hypothetical protein
MTPKFDKSLSISDASCNMMTGSPTNPMRVRNKPQMFVNFVSVGIGFSGLVKAFG